MSITLAIKTLFTGSHSNEWLINRFIQTGDKKILEQLYDNCADDLYHYIVTQSDNHLAKDICQKTWLKVIEKPHLYQESGRFIAWLFTIARNTLIDEFRKNNRWQSFSDELDEKQVTQFELDESLADAFDRVLLALPFEQREAFCLQQEGFGLQEIANITHSGAETVKSRIRYAKQSFKRNLEKYHD